MEQKRDIDNAVIECNNIAKTYTSKRGESKVIGGIDLAVQENEFVVLFGPGLCS
jgi:NitT/TauT family transport system ATP-binding protein/sulfonate transport system ATP-binding protein